MAHTHKTAFNQYIIAFFAVALAARVQAVWSLDASVGGVHFWVLLRGFLSDAVAAALLGTLLGSLPWRAPAWVLAGLCLYIYAGNTVYVLYNHSNLSIDDSAMLMEKEFLVSMLSLEVLANGAAYAAIFVAAYALGKKARSPFTRAEVAVAGTALLLCMILWPVGLTAPDWLQRSLPEANIAQLLRINAATHKSNPEALKPFLSHDLSGEPIVAPPQGKPNVLLIIVESLSGQFIERGYMPYLSSLSQKTLFFPNFVTLQRQTHNGVYSLLCGDLPSMGAKIRNGMAELGNKWSTVVRTGTPYPCLPERLRQAGYSTVFLQGCDLNFVSGNLFAERTGFAEYYDDKSFAYPARERAKWRGWGAPDNIFFDQGLSRMRKLEERGKPWFVTMMTVGTHQPYNIPRNYMPRQRDRKHAAFTFTDEALRQLLESMEKEGLLKNTVVMITGDESAADLDHEGNAADLLPANWITMLVKLPSNEARVVADYFRQSDVMVSILDYLGIPSGAVTGRSLFRSYATFRPLMFANNVLDRWNILPEPDKLIMCLSNFTNCAQYALAGTLFHAVATPMPEVDPAIESYREAALASDRRFENNQIFSWDNPQEISGKRVLVQRLRLEKSGDRAVALDFSLRTPAGNKKPVQFRFNIQKVRQAKAYWPKTRAIYRHPFKIPGGKTVSVRVMIPAAMLESPLEAFAAVLTRGRDKVTVDHVEVKHVPDEAGDNHIGFTVEGAE